MKPVTLLLFSSILIQPLISAGSPGTDASEGPAGVERAEPKQNTSLIRASRIIGAEVWNPRNERLGEIKDLMLNQKNEKIIYVVLGTGGFLGLRDKLVALPPNAFALSIDQKNLVIDADKEALKTAPGFENNNWPEMAASDWKTRNQPTDSAPIETDIQEAAGADAPKKIPPTVETSREKETEHKFKASKLIGASVKNSHGERLGTIEDVAVNLSDGKILYFAVSTEGITGVGKKLVAISAFSFQPSGSELDTFILDTPKDVFTAAAGFESDQKWPLAPDRTFSRITVDEPAGAPLPDSGDGRTAVDQSNARRDLMITQQLRRAIMRDDTMSVLTKNITIITADGTITVRGIVANQGEVNKIVAFAREIAGNKVINELKTQEPGQEEKR